MRRRKPATAALLVVCFGLSWPWAAAQSMASDDALPVAHAAGEGAGDGAHGEADRRMGAVLRLLGGASPEEVAGDLGESEEIVLEWKTEFLKAGSHAFHEPQYLLSTTAWALISFLLVLLILTKKLFPMILGAMDKRAEEIKNSLDAAEKARAEAAEMIQKHEVSLEEARREAAEIVEEGRRDAERLSQDMVERARKEASEVTERSIREIKLAKAKAIDDLDKRAVQLSLDIAGKLVQKNLSEQDHKTLIEERLSSFKEFQS